MAPDLHAVQSVAREGSRFCVYPHDAQFEWHVQSGFLTPGLV